MHLRPVVCAHQVPSTLSKPMWYRAVSLRISAVLRSSTLQQGHTLRATGPSPLASRSCCCASHHRDKQVAQRTWAVSAQPAGAARDTNARPINKSTRSRDSEYQQICSEP